MPDVTPRSPPVDCQVDARFFAPPDDLDGCLTSIYRLDLQVERGAKAVDWLQPEWGNLRVFSGDLPRTRVGEGPTVSDVRFTFTGPSSRSARFELGTTRMWGIGLLPLGWARFVGKPAASYANLLADAERHPEFARFAALPEVFRDDPDDDAEFEHIVKILRASAQPVPAADAIGAVHRAMLELDLATVGDFAALAGLSVRALERICRRHFGFAPKLLLRRQRFMRSLAGWMVGRIGSVELDRSTRSIPTRRTSTTNSTSSWG